MILFDAPVYKLITTLLNVLDPTTILIMKFITTLGSSIVICTVIFSLFVLLKDKKYFWYTAIACLVGSAFEHILKIIIRRPRPEEFWPLTVEKTYSFPSGHTFMSVVLYGLLIYYINKNVKSKKLRYLGTCIFSLIIFLVAVSRLYLGVHYATDVVGGLILGTIYLIAFIILVIERKERKDKKLKKGLEKSREKQISNNNRTKKIKIKSAK